MGKRRSFGNVNYKGRRAYPSYIGPDGKRHRPGHGFPTDLDANAWLLEERRLIDRNIWTPPADRRAKAKQRRMTVHELLDRHMAHLKPDLRTSTYEHYERTVTNRITGVTGPAGRLRDVHLPDLDEDLVGDWWRALKTQFPDTPETNRKAYVRLRAAAEWGTGEREIPLDRNPVVVADAGKKSAPKRRKELATAEEFNAIIAALPDRYKVVGIMCLFHGLRIGEALGLRRKDIEDGDDGMTVHVRGNLQRVTGTDGKQVMVYQLPKTDVGARAVPVIPEHEAAIRDHLKEFTGRSADSYVTTTATGAPVLDTSFRSRFNTAKRKAGVRSDITPHWGRNYLITELAGRGATPAEIGEILGQKDLKTILETYMRVRPGRPRELMSGVS